MGLSNSPYETVNTYQVLLEIAQHLNALTSDPKALEQSIKDANALSESEEKKAEEARARIAEMQALVAEQKKQGEELDADFAALNVEKEEVLAAKKANEKNSTLLDRRQSALSEAETASRLKLKDVELREVELTAGIAKLKEGQDALAARAKAVDDYEASLKSKASQLQKLAEGM